MNSFYDVVIVGAGHAGAQAAMNLVKLKFGGSICILGDEPYIPYERPPLSKEYFSGDKPFEKILIRPESFWKSKGIKVCTGNLVIKVDAQAKIVTTKKNKTISYGKLIWATGGSPRTLPLPGADLKGVQGLRTKDDADLMKSTADQATNIVIIGGGYIGLEAAAVLNKMGKKVTLLEALPRVLNRVAGEALSEFYQEEHRSRGVDIRLQTNVEYIEGSDHVTGVKLSSGDVIPAELVIVGIGIIPEIGPLMDAGAKGDNGIAVDEYCQSSLSDIFVIGDCAKHVNKYFENNEIRLESVQNANDMSVTVAGVLCGKPEPYDKIPWFWSNQYDLRLQTVGLSTNFDDTVVRGDMSTRSFSVIYLRAGKVIALDCVNAMKDYVQGKALIINEIIVDKEILSDTSKTIKEIIKNLDS